MNQTPAEPTIADVLVAVRQLDTKIDRKVDGLRDELRGEMTEMRGEMTEMRSEIRENRDATMRLEGELIRVRDDLNDFKLYVGRRFDRQDTVIAALRTDMNDGFRLVREDLAGIKVDIAFCQAHIADLYEAHEQHVNDPDAHRRPDAA